ncbi:MAG: PDZ domain-containing protein, partial [bacterium]
ISARGRSGLAISGGEGPSYQDFIQTDASINFGNSGGPLVNIRGEVIGINTAINAQGQGIGFAIPINLARKVMEQLIATGEVRRGYLGIVPSELDPVKREALGLDPQTKGVLVEDVQVGTPADKGGLKGGDVVLEIDGKPVDNVTDFRFRIADHPPGSDLRLTILRDGKRKEFTFKLADRKDFLASGQRQQPRLRGDKYWLGIEVAETNSEWGRRFGVEDLKGVVVVSVQPNSPADGILQPGDVIVEIGEIEITSGKDYQEAKEKFKTRTRAIPFWVIRDGRRTFIPIKPE